MPKTAKVKRFKLAFLKPKHPDKFSQNVKTDVEKTIAKMVKKGDESGELKSKLTSQSGRLLSKEAEPKHRAYAEELLAYKLTKHWDDEKEFKVWRDSFGDPSLIGPAVRKLLASNSSDKFLLECVDRFSQSSGAMDACLDANPDLVVEHMIGEKKKLPKGFDPTFSCDRLKGKMFAKLFIDGERDDLPAGYRRCVSQDDALAMVLTDRQGYVDTYLRSDGKVGTDDQVHALMNPAVREELAKDEGIWTDLLLRFPMLGFLEDANKNAEKEGTQREKELSLAESVFDEMLRTDNKLNLTYFTNNFTRPNDALGASPGKMLELVEAERTKLMNMGNESVPNQPAAQCDVLVSILSNIMQAALGPNATVKCKPIVIPEMVLTVPIDQLPGPDEMPGKGGLLPTTFGGNVYEDDAATPNKQVFFTGQGIEQPNAHTYLDVDGELYDAVLGTKGDDVIKAVAEKFSKWEEGWTTVGEAKTAVKVAKGNKGSWIIEVPGLKAAPNSHGFATGYRITKNIELYAVPPDAPNDDESSSESDKSDESDK